MRGDMLLMYRGWGQDVSSSELEYEGQKKTDEILRTYMRTMRYIIGRAWALDKDSCASLPDVL
jgi:hypothetical protein